MVEPIQIQYRLSSILIRFSPRKACIRMVRDFSISAIYKSETLTKKKIKKKSCTTAARDSCMRKFPCLVARFELARVCNIYTRCGTYALRSFNFMCYIISTLLLLFFCIIYDFLLVFRYESDSLHTKTQSSIGSKRRRIIGSIFVWVKSLS